MRFLLFFFFLFSAAFAEEHVFLHPPCLQEDAILKEVVCTRPLRQNGMRIEHERIENKTIIHCYGHGTCGWSTLFGSVSHAVSLLREKQPIRVIGAGCMGLATAIELKRIGYPVVGIIADELYELPSWRAVGLFSLPLMKSHPKEKKHIHQLGRETFAVYCQIDRGEHPYIDKSAVKFMPIYCQKSKEENELYPLVACGLIPKPADVTIDFGNGISYPDFQRYFSFYLDTAKLMEQLHAEVQRLEIPIERKTVRSFEEIEEPVIFNCSGLGAKMLAGDSSMKGYRGHLLLLSPSAGNEHLDYMISVKVLQDGREQVLHLFPKTHGPAGLDCAGVVGGTYIDEEGLTQEKLKEIDEEEFRKLKKRLHDFFYCSSG